MKLIKEFYKAWPCTQGWQFEPCFLAECPRPCTWGAWGPWGPCTQHCGTALRRRSRQVEAPAAWEGVACRKQDSREVALCQNHPCLETAISDSFSQAEQWLTMGTDLLLEGFMIADCNYKTLGKFLPKIVELFEGAYNSYNQTQRELAFPLKSIVAHLKQTERLRQRYVWEKKQEIIILGLKRAAQVMSNRSDEITVLSKSLKSKLKYVGGLIKKKTDSCKSRHLTDMFLLDL